MEGTEGKEGVWCVSDGLGLQGRMAGYTWHAKTALNSKVKQWASALITMMGQLR